MEEYLLKFENVKDLIVIDENQLSIIVQFFKQKHKKKLRLEMNQIITNMNLVYLIKVINANRHIDGFEYSYITKETIRQEEVCKIISYQLTKLTINGRPCFRKIKYILNKHGKREIIIKCTQFFVNVCRHSKRILIYRSSIGKYKIKIST